MSDPQSAALEPAVPRGRLAPSPTGAQHLGNARTFLITWLSIRARGGSLVFRMEDLDHPRVKPGAAGEARTDLQWLGLDWDEGPDVGGTNGPYVQSERRAYYRSALDLLRSQGRVYPCVCSRKDVESAQSAPQEGEDGMVYAGTCRDLFETFEAAAEQLPHDRCPAWRFRVDPGVTEFEDGLHGPRQADAHADAGDFAIARDPDGAGYMLGVVVDDAAMGITEIIRGDDLLATTHRQIHLQKALGLPQPRYTHVPLVVGPDGRRLAKRHGDTRISMFRNAGVPASRVVGMLAWWCGWAEKGESVMPRELIERFDLRTIPREPIVLHDAVLGGVMANGC